MLNHIFCAHSSLKPLRWTYPESSTDCCCRTGRGWHQGWLQPGDSSARPPRWTSGAHSLLPKANSAGGERASRTDLTSPDTQALKTTKPGHTQQFCQRSRRTEMENTQMRLTAAEQCKLTTRSRPALPGTMTISFR